MDEGSTPFRHGVASGDPTGDAVVIWTRVTAPGRRPCRWPWWLEPADGGPGARLAGSVDASPDRDWTVASTSAAWRPDARYRYGFDGARRVVGGRAGPGRCHGTTSRGSASPRSRARSSTPGSSTPTPGSPSATTSTSSSTWATTSTRRRTRRPRARRRAPTSAGRSTRSTSAGRSTTTGAATRSTAPIRTRRRCTPRTRSSPPSTTTSSPTARGATARTEHDEERDGPWSRRRADGVPRP